MIIPILLILSAWTLAIFFSSVADTVLFRKNHMFSRINKEKYPRLHRYFNLDKDWWKRQYVNNNPKKGRKKIWIFTVPPAVFDAWHGFKLLRQTAYFHTVGAPLLYLYILGIFEALILYALIMGTCVILSYTVHFAFFHDIFKK